MDDEVVFTDHCHCLVERDVADNLVDVVLHLFAIGSAEIGHHCLSWLRVQIQEGIAEGAFKMMMNGKIRGFFGLIGIVEASA